MRITPAKYLFFLPAITGYLLHFPLYIVLKTTIQKKTSGTVFCDSILFGVLLFIYPLYLLLVAIFLWLVNVPATIVFLVLLAHPVSAWFAVRRKAL